MEQITRRDESFPSRSTDSGQLVDTLYNMISGDNGSSRGMQESKNGNESGRYLGKNSSTSEHGQSKSRIHFSAVSAMELFKKAKSVRLKSHHDKYLTAGSDKESIIQDRSSSSKSTEWTVEFVVGAEIFLRFKSCYGKYLTASDEAFLLGMTGQKVLQTLPRELGSSVEWEPFMEGTKVKLKARSGNYLRANGGLPPWRNSITHDIPYTHNDWICWEVEIVEARPEGEFGTPSFQLPSSSSRSPSPSDPSSRKPRDEDDTEDSKNLTGPTSPQGPNSKKGEYHAINVGEEQGGSTSSEHGQPEGRHDFSTVSAMEFLKKAKTIQLKSYHDKYLTAHSDEKSVVQDLSGWTNAAEWKVEIVEGTENFLRLRSCYGKYLTALDDAFLLGMTGQKVVQTTPKELDSSVEWEPFMDGTKLKLKARYGNFLRANGSLPPWRNSITHDIPYTHHDWICWEVDTIETHDIPYPRGYPRGSKWIEILKCVVYGGLVELITSLSIVASAAAAETATMNIVALGLANVISGVFVIAHSLRDMKNHHPVQDLDEQTERYEELIGARENFLLHFSFVILSFLLFGLIPPLVYGLAFELTNNNDYTIIAVAVASLICIILLSIGKAYCQGDKSYGDYFKTMSYYISNAVAVAGVAFGMGDAVKIVVEKIDLFNQPSTLASADLVGSATPLLAIS